MPEEPDDESDREPSDASSSGSDEERVESEDEPERAAPEEAAPDDDEPNADDQESDADDEPESDVPEDEADGGPDAEQSETEESNTDEADDGDDAPEFTNVEGLGPDTGDDSDDGESDGDADESDGDADESADRGRMFEDYDPDAPPEESTAPAAHGPVEATPGQSPQSTRDDTEDEGMLGGGPDSDQEMPLAAHIEEMMKRLSVVFLVGGAVALTLLGLGQLSDQVPTAVDLIDILWNNAIPGAPEIEGRRPRVYGPMELILTELKVTALAGLLVALPVFVYETYLFMRPGLYPQERRYYISAIPTSLILGAIGMAFSHFVIIPAIMRYFTLYTDENVATVAYGLESTFSLILVLMGYMAIIFQIPLFIMLAIMMGIVTRQWLEDKRLLFWGGFLTIAFLVNPDPTGMTPFIIAATMIVLYEGTLAMLRWTGN
jgi:sec-independent protein translocase protein TatC